MTTTFNQARTDSRFLTMSEGNKKLKPTKDVKYLIWNIPAIITCPFATAHCIEKCYAVKAEKQYPSARESRAKHFESTKADNFIERVTFTLSAHLDRKSYKTAKKVIVRIHESGDFYSKEYAEKWLEIARSFENNPKVKFMAYTKSVGFFQGQEIPKNMTIRFSLWDDTDPAQYAIARDLELPIYTAVDKFTDETKAERCLCKNCSTCQKCWSALKMIKCEIH